MDDAEAAVLAEAARIIDNEHATQGACAYLKDMFNLGDRQALLALHQIRENFHRAAAKAGMTFSEYVDAMPMHGKTAIFGFCVGAVQQRDVDLRRDKETGERLGSEMEYEI